MAKNLWNKLPIPPSFFSSNHQDWFSTNFNSHLFLQDFNLPWNILFPNILWLLWKRRNNWVFNKISTSVEEVINLAKFHALEFICSQNIPSSSPPYPSVSWNPPPPGSFKCNSDASFSPLTLSCGFGGLIRDEKGSCILAWQGSFPCSSAFAAECKSLMLTLSWLKFKGWSSIAIESDCKRLVDDINSSSPAISFTLKMILSCRVFCKEQNFTITWVPRSGNAVADHLAREARKMKDAPPEVILEKRLFDKSFRDLVWADADSPLSESSSPSILLNSGTVILDSASHPVRFDVPSYRAELPYVDSFF